MAPNTTNIARYHPVSHCVSRFAVFGTVCLAVVILNIITIIIFVKQRQLQRKSTYLIIHLAIVDLLVGAVTGPLWIEFFMSWYCDLWEYDMPDNIWLFVLGRASGFMGKMGKVVSPFAADVCCFYKPQKHHKL